MILPSQVLTDKEQILELARIFADAQKQKRIKTQFNLLDLGTVRDGRFLSYGRDYTEWLKKEAKVVSGENYLGELNGLDFRSNPLQSAAFNFRRVRNLLFYSYHLAETEPKKLFEKTEVALESIAKFPKSLILLSDGRIIVSRKDAKKELETLVGNIDLSFIESLELLLRDPARFYSELENPYNSARLLSQGLECLERMILAYITKFPEVNDREARG